MANTGRLIYRKLEQYNTATGAATGVVKDNIEGTEGYVPPVENSTQCPIEGVVYELSINPTYVRLPHRGGIVFIDIRSNVDWEARLSSLQFASVDSGYSLTGSGDGYISITVDEHYFTGGSRSLYVSIVSSDDSLEVICHVQQDAYTGGTGGEGGGDDGDNPDEPIPHDPHNPY